MQVIPKFQLKSHKNGIETTLGLLDETLLEFEAWAHGRENRSVLYRELNTLSEDQREKILIQVQKIRAVLGEIRDDLDAVGTHFRDHILNLHKILPPDLG